MDEKYFNKITTTIILATLLILSFLLLKPILIPIVIGLVLTAVFHPIYQRLNEKIKSENISSILVCTLFVLLVIIPLWFLIPVLLNQSLEIYSEVQNMDFITPLKTTFPSLFTSEKVAAEVNSVIYSTVTKVANSAVTAITNILINLPVISLQFLVALFTFYFFLKDKERFQDYIKSLLPFSKEVEKKLFKQTGEITLSVIYGQVVVGILQGVLVGIGFFLFGLENALVLTILACIAGVFPIIGTTIIWLPTAIFLFLGGSVWPAIGISVFGFLSSIADNLVRPMFISQRTRMHPSIVLIGMIGGLYLFGFLGFIMGPLILAYLLIILEIYRNKAVPEMFFQKTK